MTPEGVLMILGLSGLRHDVEQGATVNMKSDGLPGLQHTMEQ